MIRYECDMCQQPIESSYHTARIQVYRQNSLKVNEFHVCLECWDKVKPAELVEVII